MSLAGCVQLANVPIALARRDDTTLSGQPLVLYTSERGRTLVYAASEETGVTAGMPLQRARVRCPHAAYMRAEPARDAQAGAALAELLGTFSPRVAPATPLPDLALTFDLGRMTVPQAMAIAERLARDVHAELGLRPAIGLAATALVARHAARRAGEGAAVLVLPGQEQALLAPLPIGSLDLETELTERLAQLGLRTVGDVARVPLDALQAQFGAAGQHLYRLARGLDGMPISTTRDEPMISVTRRFAGPLLDCMLLEQAFEQAAARLSTQLGAGGWSARAVGLTLELDDGDPAVVARRLPEPTAERARLGAALRGLGQGVVLEAGVISLTATAYALAPAVAEQLELFGPAGGQATRLRDVLERLQGRFEGSLLRATLAEPGAALPERRVRLERR